jgi:multidrug resistance efflux pump
MRVDASDLIELAKANGFESVTEAITVAKKSHAEIERLQHHVACAEHAMQEMMKLAKQADAEIERLRAALEPFQRNVESLSLSGALGHIGREELWNARYALEQSIAAPPPHSRAEIERLRAARDEMLVALKAVYEITLPEKLHRLVVDAIANATRHKGGEA